MRRERQLTIALAISLAVHGLLLFATGRWASGMPAEIGFPIEASLAALEARPEPKPVPSEPVPADAPSAAPQAEPEPAAPESAEPARELPPREPPLMDPPALVSDAAMPRDMSRDMPVRDEPSGTMMPRDDLPRDVLPSDALARDDATPSGPAPRMLVAALPELAEIRYTVRYGSGGFAAGEARYRLQSRDGRYSLLSRVEAKGLASLFVSGRIVQTSEGAVGDDGLRPEQYSLEQGERRRDSARFDRQRNRVELGGNRGSVPLSQGAQDLLSFPFHLAATARAGEPEFELAIGNGRKMQVYRFQVVGMEHLELPLGALDALHIQGRVEAAGTLDVWLDPQRANLPVKVRTLDQKGKEVTLAAEEVKYTPAEVRR